MARPPKPRDMRLYVQQGEVFKLFRVRAGLLQKDVSRAMEKDDSFMSRVESGQRRVDLVEWQRLCEVLGIRPETWLRRSQRMSGQPVAPVRGAERPSRLPTRRGKRTPPRRRRPGPSA